MTAPLHGRVLAAAALALLVGCGKAPSPASRGTVGPAIIATPLAPPVAPEEVHQANAGVTIFGAIKEADWYMVVTSPNNVKPLIIWSESKTECDANVVDFNLKSIAPDAKGEAPKAWCMTGKDLRSRFKIS